MERVGRERADPHGAAAGVLQDGLDLTRLHGPDQRGGVGGAGGQELTTGRETAAVDAIAMAQQGRERQLGEVLCVVYAQGFVSGTRGQQAPGEGAPVHVVPVVLQRADQRRHLESPGPDRHSEGESRV